MKTRKTKKGGAVWNVFTKGINKNKECSDEYKDYYANWRYDGKYAEYDPTMTYPSANSRFMYNAKPGLRIGETCDVDAYDKYALSKRSKFYVPSTPLPSVEPDEPDEYEDVDPPLETEVKEYDFNGRKKINIRGTKKRSTFKPFYLPESITFNPYLPNSIIIFIACHGETILSTIKKVGDSYELNPLKLPEDMKLTIMAASEIGIPTCDFLENLEGEIKPFIDKNIQDKENVDLTKIQSHLYRRKNVAVMRQDDEIYRQEPEGTLISNGREGWNISHHCIERRYTSDYKTTGDGDAYSFSTTPRKYKAFNILYHNSSSPGNKELMTGSFDLFKKIDHDIFDSDEGADYEVNRSDLFKELYKRGFKNICIFDISCGGINDDMKKILNLEELSDMEVSRSRVMNQLRRQARKDLIAGRKTKKHKN